MSGQRIEFAATRRSTRAAADNEEEHRHGTQDDGQRQQPAADQLPGRQREQIEGDRPAEDRIEPMPAAFGAYQYSARVGQSAVMPAPVAAAMASDNPTAISLRTGSTGSLIGWPLMRMLLSSPSRSRLEREKCAVKDQRT